jgi:hypothetical protein
VIISRRELISPCQNSAGMVAVLAERIAVLLRWPQAARRRSVQEPLSLK